MKKFGCLTGICLGVTFILATFSTLVNAQKNPSLSDAEVASVAVAANQIGIGYADIAQTKSKDAEVLKFAETMKRDHTAIIGQAAVLVKN